MNNINRQRNRISHYSSRTSFKCSRVRGSRVQISRVCRGCCMFVCVFRMRDTVVDIEKKNLQYVAANGSENLLAGLGECHPGKGRGEGFRVHLAARALQVIILPCLSIRRLKHQPIKPHVIKPFKKKKRPAILRAEPDTRKDADPWSVSRRAGKQGRNLHCFARSYRIKPMRSFSS